MNKSGNRKAAGGKARAFTLIELLVVISIIGVLAAFTITVLKGVKRHQYLTNAQAEMGQLESALEAYKSAYGFYPPANPNSVIFNPLYYELLGTTRTTNTLGNTVYQTLDGSASINDSDLTSAPPGPLGVGGFINCSKTGASEDAPAAQNFLPGLRANEYGLDMTNNSYPSVQVALLLCSVGGPDQSYQPLGSPGINPWRYSYPGTNNPGGYDLYVQLVIAGQTNLVCNWSKQVQINNPLP